jgi:hypothetical protein
LTLHGAPSIRTGNGGGRNPAAAVLWIAPLSAFLPEHGILKNTQLETQQQTTQFERPARSSPTNRAITAEG